MMNINTPTGSQNLFISKKVISAITLCLLLLTSFPNSYGGGDDEGGSCPNQYGFLGGIISVGAIPVLNGHLKKGTIITKSADSARTDFSYLHPLWVERYIQHQYAIASPVLSREESRIPTFQEFITLYTAHQRHLIHQRRLQERSIAVQDTTMVGVPGTAFSPPRVDVFSAGACHHEGAVVDDFFSIDEFFTSHSHCFQPGPDLICHRDYLRGFYEQYVTEYQKRLHLDHVEFLASKQVPIYDVKTMDAKSISVGGVVFAGVGPVAAGVGALGDRRWATLSKVKTVGLDTARKVEANPPKAPKSLAEVMAWGAPSTDVSWSQHKGYRLIGGMYAIGAAGAQGRFSGTWRTRVQKVRARKPSESDTITVGLSYLGRKSIKGVATLFPVAKTDKDLVHAANKQEIKFSFNMKSITAMNPVERATVTEVLDDLIQGKKSDKELINRAKAMADRYASMGAQAPIAFTRASAIKDWEDVSRARLRIPGLAEIQKRRGSCQQTEKVVDRVGEDEVHSEVVTASVFKDRTSQVPLKLMRGGQPIRSILTKQKEEVVVTHKTVDVSEDPVAREVARMNFFNSDNHMSREEFLGHLEALGNRTGLRGLLPQEHEIDEFDRSHPNPRFHGREGVEFNLHLSMTAAAKQKIAENILIADASGGSLFLSRLKETVEKHFSAFGRSSPYCMRAEAVSVCKVRVLTSVENEAKDLIRAFYDTDKFLARGFGKSLRISLLGRSGNSLLSKVGLGKSKLTQEQKLNLEAKALALIKNSDMGFIFLQALQDTGATASFGLETTSIEANSKTIDLNQAFLMLRGQATR